MSKADGLMKRWQEQRWLLDTVIRTVGVEWDQPRLAYMAAPAGPEAFGEFRLVGERVKKVADIDREFARGAVRREARAEAYEAADRPVAARESYLIAALLWASARWPIFEVNDRLLFLEERMNECYAKYAEHAAHPISRVKIPFDGKVLPAYMHLPHEPADGERFPCVISIPGMDSCKENGVSMYGDALLERGIAVLAVDGPGQAESISLGVNVTQTNHMDAAHAYLDWLSDHPHVDMDRLAIKGTSFGTYFGTQVAAALGDRVKGCAITGVCQEPGCHTIFNMASPSFKLRFMWMAGFEDEDAFDAFAQRMDLRPIAGDVSCPYLVIAGEDDQLSPVEHTYELFDLIKSPKKLVVFEGANHSVSEGMSTRLGENRNTLIADFLKDRIDGKPMTSEKVVVDSTGREHATPA
jgi:fermentation-respiration switch protein FrsA (DUF1100 family)